MSNRNHQLLNRLAGLQPTRPRSRVRLAQFAGGALLVTTLGVAVPEARRPQTEGTALVEVLALGKRSAELTPITVGTHARMVFSKEVSDRIQVANRVEVNGERKTTVEIVSIDAIGQRELMLHGQVVGKTTMTVWFEDNTVEQFVVTVQRDMSVLETALRQIHPNILAEIAPDRDAIVLTGVVPNRDLALEAQKVTASYLSAEKIGGDLGDGESETSNILNLIRWGGGDTAIEHIIQDAIHEELECHDVTVTRVSELEFLGEADILILKGSVPDQTRLTQVLALSSRLFLQQDLVRRKRAGEFEEVTEVLVTGETRTTRRPLTLSGLSEDIRVAANEAGALFQDDEGDLRSGQALGQLGRGSGFGGSAGGANFGALLTNSLESNIGRAKALELADGRILSFIEVGDLPQVRVDIRLYEVNRNALLDWNSEFIAGATDYNQASRLNPDLDGAGNPVPQDSSDVRNILSFLSGRLANQFDVSGGNYEISQLFSVLETEGIARVVSSPSITVLSGELASFGVGGQVPIENVAFAGTGVAAGSVTFVEFGVNLAVRPLVGEGDFITLDVVPQVSNPDAELTAQIVESSGETTPTTAFSQRVMRTTSRLRDGQSLVIGGLSERARFDESGETPWLHDIPLLGWLFKDFSYEDADRQLVIVLHPVIVRDEPEEARLWIYPEPLDLLPQAAVHSEEEDEEGGEDGEDADDADGEVTR